MNIFKDICAGKNGMIDAAAFIANYTDVPSFLETDDAIYIDGIPCDKYTLAPITAYKDRPLMISGTMKLTFGVTPFTSTRYFNRYIADGNKFPYRNPMSPAQTLLRNNARLSNQDEVLVTPSGTYAASSGYTNAVLYFTKANNKITGVLTDDLMNYKAGIVALDDLRYLTTKNNANHRMACYQGSGISYGTIFYSPQDALLEYFNKANTQSMITLSAYGNLDCILGKTNNGDLIVLFTGLVGSGTFPIMAPLSTFNIAKIAKSNLAVTNLVSTAVTPTSGAGYGYCSALWQIPGISSDCSEIYFVDAKSTPSVYRLFTLALNKYKVDIANGTVTAVPLTVNLNGLASAIKEPSGINEYQYNSYAKTGAYTSVALNYLDFGSSKYLLVSPIINTEGCKPNYGYQGALTTSSTGTYPDMIMYLFKINGDTLDLVDVKQTFCGASDYPQAIFPVNNNKNLVFVRYGGSDILTVDAVNDKILLQNTINEQIYSLGIDELERIWYTTSTDALVTDCKLKVMSVGSVVSVTTSFADINVTYVDSDISSSLNVSARDNTASRVAANIQLLLEGPAIFTSTGTKTINISTNTSGDVNVPITIQGDGMVSVYTNINTGSS